MLDLILSNFHFALLMLSLVLGAFSWTGEAFCRYMLLFPSLIDTRFMLLEFREENALIQVTFWNGGKYLISKMIKYK